MKDKSSNRDTSGIAGFIDPTHNLITGMMFACIPGIIYGIDSYSQIKCLYADCLQNAVGKDGLPISSCQNLKAYSTCKYVTGEVFAAIPYAALFDHFSGILKEAISNPFAAIGLGAGAVCYFTCAKHKPGSAFFYTACDSFKLLSKAGEVYNSIKGLARDGFKIRQNYCDRLSSGETLTALDANADAIK